MKKLLIVLISCVCLSSIVAYAENPVGVLFKGQYTIMDIADNIRIVTVNNSSWETIVRYHFGGKHSNPWDVLGFNVVYKRVHKGVLSSSPTYIYWVFVRASYNKVCEHQSGQELMEEVLGHEFMHILNYQQKLKGNPPPYDIDGKDLPVK